jgi:hypothetical protein
MPALLRPASLSQDREFPAAAITYAGLIRALHALTPPAAPVRLSDAAVATRIECERKHLALAQTYETLNKKFAAHVGKYDGIFVARLCLTWHCIEAVERGGALPATVTEVTAQRVAGFMHGFLLPHAAAFYTAIFGLADNHDQLAAVAGYILAHKLDVLTNRDMARGNRTMRGLKKHEMENVYSQLEALGWLERIPGRYPSSPPRWNVNPEVHRRFEQRAQKEREHAKAAHRGIAAFLQEQQQQQSGD